MLEKVGVNMPTTTTPTCLVPSSAFMGTKALTDGPKTPFAAEMLSLSVSEG